MFLPLSNSAACGRLGTRLASRHKEQHLHRFASQAASSAPAPLRSPTVKEVLRRDATRTLYPAHFVDQVGVEGLSLNDLYGHPNKLLLNLSLCNYHVAPQRLVFRNLHLRGLVHHSKGAKEVSQAVRLKVPSGGAAVPMYTVAEEESASSHTLSRAKFEKLVEKVGNTCSESDVFVHDGAIGTHSWASVRARAIVSDPDLALFIKHMIPTESIVGSHSSDPRTFEPRLAIYIVPEFHLKKPGNYGLEGSNFIAFDGSGTVKTLIIAGSKSTEAVRNAVFFAASSIVLGDSASDTLPVVGDVLLGKNGSTTLVLNPGDLLLNKKLTSIPMMGAHNHFWSSQGLVPAWQGIRYPYELPQQQLRFGDLIETDGSSTQTTVRLPTPNALQSPSNVIFLIEDQRNALPTVSKLSPQQATDCFLSGYNGQEFEPFFNKALLHADPQQLALRFQKHVEAKGVGLYMINTSTKGKQLKQEDVSKLIDLINNGSLVNSKTDAGFKLFSPISSVPGFKTLATDSPSAQQLETDMVAFLKQKFPWHTAV